MESTISRETKRKREREKRIKLKAKARVNTLIKSVLFTYDLT